MSKRWRILCLLWQPSYQWIKLLSYACYGNNSGILYKYNEIWQLIFFSFLIVLPIMYWELCATTVWVNHTSEMHLSTSCIETEAAAANMTSLKHYFMGHQSREVIMSYSRISFWQLSVTWVYYCKSSLSFFFLSVFLTKPSKLDLSTVKEIKNVYPVRCFSYMILLTAEVPVTRVRASFRNACYVGKT